MSLIKKCHDVANNPCVLSIHINSPLARTTVPVQYTLGNILNLKLFQKISNELSIVVLPSVRKYEYYSKRVRRLRIFGGIPWWKTCALYDPHSQFRFQAFVGESHVQLTINSTCSFLDFHLLEL